MCSWVPMGTWIVSRDPAAVMGRSIPPTCTRASGGVVEIITVVSVANAAGATGSADPAVGATPAGAAEPAATGTAAGRAELAAEGPGVARVADAGPAMLRSLTLDASRARMLTAIATTTASESATVAITSPHLAERPAIGWVCPAAWPVVGLAQGAAGAFGLDTANATPALAGDGCS